MLIICSALPRVNHQFSIATCQSSVQHCHGSIISSALPRVNHLFSIATCQSSLQHCHVSIISSALPRVSHPFCTDPCMPVTHFACRVSGSVHLLHCHVFIARSLLSCGDGPFCVDVWPSPVLHCYCYVRGPVSIAMCQSLLRCVSRFCHVSVVNSALPRVSRPVSIAMFFVTAMGHSSILHCHVSVVNSALPCVSMSCFVCFLHCHVSVTQSALPCVSRPWCIANVHPEYPHCICHCLNHQCCFASRLDHRHCFVHSPIVVTWQMSALRLTGAL